jgi:3'(2'), 5'-bisphosphate nucleotidase/myo-inositol-1(or 4)-monophosphatase
MKLSTDDLLSLHQVAILAATEAGQLIAEHANKVIAVQHKSGGDSLASQVVTEVDLLSESVILKRLRPVCEQYDLALLSEESTDDRSRLKKDYFWSIDPLDGTLCFIESTHGYAVSIALVSRVGSPIIGVVYDPVLHTCYSAIQGQGAWCNGEVWAPAVNDSMQGKVLTLIGDRSLLQRSEYPQMKQAVEILGDKLGLAGVKMIDRSGGAVMSACWVLEHSPACYFKLPKVSRGGGCVWDFAATTAIFHELKAVATDFHGQPLALNHSDDLYMNRDGVLFATHQALAKSLSDLVI